VQDAAPSVLDDEETVEQAECQRRHGEEVEADKLTYHEQLAWSAN
jgi:hypothetical protein